MLTRPAPAVPALLILLLGVGAPLIGCGTIEVGDADTCVPDCDGRE